MKVFVTGGSGFVGRAVIDVLLAQGHSVNALVDRRPLVRSGDRIESFPGGLFDDLALDAAMADCDAVIHLVGIIAEKPSQKITFERIHFHGTRQVLLATARAGIYRYLHMSALGAAPSAASNYQHTKFQAEFLVQDCDLDWTIFRPSLIVGPGGDFSKMEERWARGKAPPWLFMPYFGGGLLGLDPPKKIQPVYVGDVARAFVDALENPQTLDEVIPLGGSQQLTWPQMHRLAAEIVTGRARPTFAIPAWFAKTVATIVPGQLLPFTRDQVVMSQQDNICDMTKFTEIFGWTPQSFEQTLRSHVHQ